MTSAGAQLPLHYEPDASSSGRVDLGDAEGGEDGVWGWMRWAGRKLGEVEAEVWRRINEVHDR